ncbi:hypothetical protein M2165_003812 [Variovorax sp. TBS-050B]|nr:hypothetical protein [Variovorax sp. TBS-050B]
MPQPTTSTPPRAARGPLALARVLHAVVALAAAGGVGLELASAILHGPGLAPTQFERLVRLFSYFTIDSNLLIGGVCALLVFRPAHDGALFRVLRLTALLCIAVTGVVFHALLTGLRELTPSGELANFLLHTVTPLGAVLGWLLVGPRPRTDRGTIGRAVLLPLAWIVYTFVRGAFVDWYPYPFMDVARIGLARAVLNSAGVAAVFLAMAFGLRWLERRLPAAPAP